MMKHVDNSPRAGVCCHMPDVMGTMSQHVMPYGRLQVLAIRSNRHWEENKDKGCRKPMDDAERASGRPHPLWDKDRKKLFRYYE